MFAISYQDPTTVITPPDPENFEAFLTHEKTPFVYRQYERKGDDFIFSHIYARSPKFGKQTADRFCESYVKEFAKTVMNYMKNLPEEKLQKIKLNIPDDIIYYYRWLHNDPNMSETDIGKILSKLMDSSDTTVRSSYHESLSTYNQ